MNQTCMVYSDWYFSTAPDMHCSATYVLTTVAVEFLAVFVSFDLANKVGGLYTCKSRLFRNIKTQNN